MFDLHFPMDAMAAFLLVFFRVSGATLSAPLFSNRSFPLRIRIWVAFLLAVICFPLAWDKTTVGTFSGLFQGMPVMVLAVGSEIFLGWCLGFIASLMVWGAQLAGHIFDQEIGLSIGAVFDPVTEVQGAIVTQLLFTLALLVFVLLDGHHLVIISVVRSFEVVPPGSFPFSAASGDFIVSGVGGELWQVGLRLALPTMAALLMVTVAMAILARVVPEMNIFVLGFALRVGLGLMLATLLLPFLVDVFREVLVTTDRLLGEFLELLAAEGR